MSTTDTENLGLENGTEEDKPKLSLDVTVETPSACQRHVTVTISRDDIDRYIDDAFKDLQSTAEVPGFRAGRAPKQLVRSRFKEQIADQVKGSLLMDSMSQVSDDEAFSAISEPDIDYGAVSVPDEGPMTFEFDVEVRPEFDLPEWKALEIERPAHAYTDKEIDDHLKRLLARHGTLVEKEKGGTADKDDYVTVDMTFRHQDEVLSEVEAESIQLRKKLSFRDGEYSGFLKLMKGCKEGDTKTAKITLSDSSPNEELRGKKIDMEIEVLEIKTVELPKLNQQFLDKIGGFENEEDLRGAVREELERQLKFHQQQKLREQITEKLLGDADWELPPELVNRQSQRELQRALMEVQSAGFGNDFIQAYANTLQQNSRETTIKALKEHFIFERIAEDQEIEAEPQDYDDEIDLIADQTDESPRRVRAKFEKRNQMDTLRNQIIERKVVELITSNAEIEEVSFEPEKNETSAVDHALGGEATTDEIPEAKHGGEAKPLPTPDDHT
ncbi:MAG: trigger factor [Pirellulaceae bacterium]|nr:trigger factor [Pirellulaceae bacterium]